MNPKTKSALALASASVALMAGTGVASAAQISGVVVDRNARSHTFVLADRHGKLREVHSRVSPALGRSVTVLASKLRNGTWAASRVRVGRSVHVARIHGTVTYVSAGKGVFVVSARGVSLLIHRHHAWVDAKDVVSFAGSLGGGLPPVGTTVTVTTDVNGDQVDATQVSDQGQNTNGVDLEGTVLAIDTTARTLSISADDSQQSAGSITVQVPASFDLSMFQVGGRVELIASLNPDGTYTLEQSSQDGSASQANNGGDQQGNGNGDQHSSAAALCLAQENDPNFASTHNGATFAQYYSIDPTETNDAFGHCVDAMASDNGATSAEAQCFAQRNDPSFPATHNGESFLQFYSTDPTQLNPGDAFGHCIDVMHQAAESQGGSSSSSGDGGSSSGSPSGDSSTSTATGGATS